MALLTNTNKCVLLLFAVNMITFSRGRNVTGSEKDVPGLRTMVLGNSVMKTPEMGGLCETTVGINVRCVTYCPPRRPQRALQGQPHSDPHLKWSFCSLLWTFFSVRLLVTSRPGSQLSQTSCFAVSTPRKQPRQDIAPLPSSGSCRKPAPCWVDIMTDAANHTATIRGHKQQKQSHGGHIEKYKHKNKTGW